MRRRLDDAEAVTLDDQNGLCRREKTPWTGILGHRQWAWPVTRKLPPDQHRQCDLGGERQTCQPLHSHRCSERPQLRDLGNIKVLTVLELLFQLAADEREAMKLGGSAFKLFGQLVDCRHQ